MPNTIADWKSVSPWPNSRMYQPETGRLELPGIWVGKFEGSFFFHPSLILEHSGQSLPEQNGVQKCGFILSISIHFLFGRLLSLEWFNLHGKYFPYQCCYWPVLEINTQPPIVFQFDWCKNKWLTIRV
eukprot:TRINITY_DN2618_c0_g1_i1.p1 TRINITY_DN2618_c0_g1~~TRINITY_DN2618_c0_g1_i1.p1  ORF type:complete len:128 (-),score=14.22 TRINITY_DN2618_c0_g1_i1:1316-1699(-)